MKPDTELGNKSLDLHTQGKTMAVINMFLDTEFTTLDERYVDAKLISVGMVDESGRHTFYAELDHWNYGECSDFTRTVVVPLLDGKSIMNWNDLGFQLKKWIEKFDTPVTIWTDTSSLDWRWLHWLFLVGGAGWPNNLAQSPSVLSFDVIRSQRFSNMVEASYAQGKLKRHHALDDAEANRRGWMAARQII